MEMMLGELIKDREENAQNEPSWIRETLLKLV
jgi:hypothetical protein